MQMQTTIVALWASSLLAGCLWAQSVSPTPAHAKPSAATPAQVGHGAVRPAGRRKKIAHTKKIGPAQVAAKPATAPAVPAPHAKEETPVLPPTLANSAPVAPQVSLKNGLLTIDAPNCTLGDVLRAVQAATGATFEGAADTERVAVHLGPAEPRQVVSTLLRGTHYDYLLVGSSENPAALAKIILSQPNAESSSTPFVHSVDERPQIQPPAMQHNHPAMNPPAATPPASKPPKPANADAAGEDEDAAPTADDQTPAETPTTEPASSDSQASPKTPEQLFQELQQMNKEKQQAAQ